ncbi:SDR family oxidoreductase [Pseudooctadecabacter jejudonensis]|uniref:2-keto-3-deoxy-L-fuconate dehydrogenase n=1 Tax=Pseudooctadecabacter jejudonensis TaxID=1391910 RepID=A0A1Y5R6A4_9RHOB|nr:SDR family oxidoreductase [Pseudooctadecabacter jejudonensis]SLN10233.1 2-keto-3-deoxy-L-fuconate dehydrogenase [Pseudooctadecabacter jejudonensis]
MSKLTAKTCLVTGAAQGIGARITEVFLEEGARVIAADLQYDGTGTGFDDTGRLNRHLDVTNPEQVAALAAEFPDINVLVNCAGYVAAGSVIDCTPADFQRSVDLNVTATYSVTAAVLPAMVEARDGVIINIASVVSSVMAAPGRFAYGATKAAVLGMTLSIARDFSDKGIRCNAISPGTVDTPSLHERLAATGDAEAAMTAFKARQMTGRLGTVDEIAAVALLMASDDATFMTGSNVVIDGGMSL